MKKFILIGCLFFNFSLFAQVTTTISYNGVSIPGSPAGSQCIFNTPNNSPKLVSGKNHYGRVGGVTYSGTEIRLFAASGVQTGLGTGYAIYTGFNTSYRYTIKIIARAASPKLQLAYAPSFNNCWNLGSNITQVPCSVGHKPVDCNSNGSISNLTNLTTSFTEYTLLNNYVPSATGVNYLVMEAFSTDPAVSGNLDIRSISITETPLCKPPSLTAAVALGNRQIRASFTPPTFSQAVTGYNIIVAKPGQIIYIGSFPIFVAGETYVFPNVGSVSPVTVALPNTANLTGSYNVIVQSICVASQTSNSNAIPVTVF